MYAVQGCSWAEATAMKTGGLVVDQVPVDGLAVDKEVAGGEEACGCPLPRPIPPKANLPDMVVERRRRKGWLVIHPAVD